MPTPHASPVGRFVLYSLVPLFAIALMARLSSSEECTEDITSSAIFMSTPETNKAVIHRLVEIQNARDFDALDDIMQPDFVRHSRATPSVNVRSREDFKAFLRQDLAAVPDSRISADMIVAEGDMAAVYASYTGTQVGPFGPFPASRKKFEIRFIAMFRFEEGRIAEIWVEWDNLDALVQLGHFTPPGADQG